MPSCLCSEARYIVFNVHCHYRDLLNDRFVQLFSTEIPSHLNHRLYIFKVCMHTAPPPINNVISFNVISLQLHENLGTVCVELACSPHISMGFPQVLRFPPTTQRCAGDMTNCPSLSLGGVRLEIERHPVQGGFSPCALRCRERL